MVINDVASLTLLFVILSLVAFWLSTQQSSLFIRLPIWIAGAGLLALAALQAWQIAGQDVVVGAAKRLADELSQNKVTPQFGVLFQTLSANVDTTRRYVLPLLDLMVAFGAILGVFAFLALTPGEFLERVFVRPLAIGLLGATVGAGLALVVVAISFGGPVELRQYAGMGAARYVHDGDTFSLGDVSVRLVDMDAPELKQVCWQGAQSARCGEAARDQLGRLIDGKILSCTPKTNAEGKTRESFGRPLVTCKVLDPATGLGQDLGAQMVATGFALPYAYKNGAPNPYAQTAAIALQNKVGLMTWCVLRPDIWRDDSKAQANFKGSGTVPADPAATAGDCSKQPRTPAA